MSDIENLPPLREIIRTHDLRAEKSLGQNFLLDLNLTSKIARTVKDLNKGTVFEIGPGPGGLTRALLINGAEKVVAVEYDTRAVHALESLKETSQGRLDILHGDALETDLLGLGCENAWPRPYSIAANLPYNIATPLLIGWLKQIHENSDSYKSLTLMFQKEVAQRIVATPSTKPYGRLSVISQWLCDTKILFDIPAGAFTPPPKVTSSVVRLVPRSAPAKIDFSLIEKITASAFGQRRKMIRGSLKPYIAHIEFCGINPQLRAEDVSVEEYERLAMEVSKAPL